MAMRRSATRSRRQARHSAGTVILTSAGMGNAAEVIRMARELNPKVQVLARAAYLRDLADMQKAGADRVFTGEGEVALGLIETILERLGATAEQIDRERDRAHRELFGQEPAESPAKAEMKPKLDAQIDELYKLPLDEFTKARNALAKTLSGEDKKTVASLVKPSLAMWIVNQLYWQDAPTYKALVDASEKLRAAHRAALSGRKADTRKPDEMHRHDARKGVRQGSRDRAEKRECRLPTPFATPFAGRLRHCRPTNLRAASRASRRRPVSAC